MKDYISREAALNFDMEIEANPDEIEAILKGMNLYGEYLKQIPDEDVRPVVLCRDCQFFYNGKDEKCCINHRGVVQIDENGYCHHARRRVTDA